MIFLAVGAASLPAAPTIREPGVLYLEDILEKPLKLPLKRAEPAYFNSALTHFAGNLRFPQTVEIVAVGDGICRVRGRAQQGQILAWVATDSIDGISPERIAEWNATIERRETIARLIANNEVAIGMTIEEVRKSVGRPTRMTNQADEDGSIQIWEYVRYRNVPRQVTVNTIFGPVVQTIMERIPVGQMIVRCKNGVVVALEQTES